MIQYHKKQNNTVQYTIHSNSIQYDAFDNLKTTFWATDGSLCYLRLRKLMKEETCVLCKTVMDKVMVCKAENVRYDLACCEEASRRFARSFRIWLVDFLEKLFQPFDLFSEFFS